MALTLRVWSNHWFQSSGLYWPTLAGFTHQTPTTRARKSQETDTLTWFQGFTVYTHISLLAFKAYSLKDWGQFLVVHYEVPEQEARPIIGTYKQCFKPIKHWNKCSLFEYKKRIVYYHDNCKKVFPWRDWRVMEEVLTWCLGPGPWGPLSTGRE